MALALEQKDSRGERKNNSPSGEMDYDALLAHYRELGIYEGPMEPRPPKEKKPRLAPPQTPGEGKFAKKRRAAPPEEPPRPKAAREPEPAPRPPWTWRT